MNELPFERHSPKTPAEILRAIESRSVDRAVAESLIKRYGDRRVREVMADLQKKMGIELSEEVGTRITHIGKLIDDFYEKTKAALNMTKPHKRRERKGAYPK